MRQKPLNKGKLAFLYKRAKILVDIIRFNKLDSTLRERLSIPEFDKDDRFKVMKILDDLRRTPRGKRKFESELKRFIKTIKTRVSKKWWEGLDLQSVLWQWLNINNTPVFGDSVAFRVRTRKGIGDRAYLEIYPDTRVEDIVENWEKQVKPIQKQLEGYTENIRDPWPFYERDKRAYELSANGKDPRKIWSELKLPSLDIGNIKRIISDYKKKMKIG